MATPHEMNDTRPQGFAPTQWVHHTGYSDAPEVVPSDNLPEVKPVQYQYVGGPHPNGQQQPPAEPTPAKKRILGLPASLFWVLVGAAALVVLGVALGAGLAVGLRKSNGDSTDSPAPAETSSAASQQSSAIHSTESHHSATPSATPSATSTAPVTSGTTGLAANSCTFQSPRTSTLASGAKFTMYCFTDWPNGGDSFDGSSKVKDITYTTVYTFEDCIEYCVKYNEDLTSDDTKCAAVTYNSNLTSVMEQGGDCFLKDVQGKSTPGSAESACAVLIA